MMSSEAHKPDKSQGDQSINLFDQPEKLNERVSLSMSLIDQEHMSTWGGGGIIVEAPEENIIIASPTDAGAFNSSKEFLKKQSQDKPVVSGDELLKQSYTEILNEVVALAKSETGAVLRLKGFFIKVNKSGQPINSVIAEKIKQHAERLNLPLIEITVKGAYEQEKFEIAKNSIYAYFKGNRYNLGSDDSNFAFSADDRANIFFPSPAEIEDVLLHFVQRGDLNEEQTRQIREKYKIADTKRKSPKIKYDPKTQEINNVTIKDGYGKDEIEYWLNPSGYCWKVNMEEFKEELKETGLNPGRPKNDTYEFLKYQTPLSGSEVLSVLATRKEMMDRKEYEKIFSFFNGIKDKIDKTCRQMTSRGKWQ